MSKLEAKLAILCGFFLGVIIGFLIAPIKKGIEIGNNAGNPTTYYGNEWKDENMNGES